MNPSSHDLIAAAIRQQHGHAFARRWVRDAGLSPTGKTQETAISHQEPFEEHPSYRRATELLEPLKDALGASYPTLHLIARWSIEHASEDDPAPHLLTTYWTLEEATGRSERTLIRHLVEDGHSWSETVRQLIDIRHNYGEMQQGDSSRPCIVGTVIRFFPEGRKSPNARVKKWGERDLISEADAGRTRPCRNLIRSRYHRSNGRMSAYSSVTEQVLTHNWLMVRVGYSVSKAAQLNSSGNLYADIPTHHVLNALRADLSLAIDHAAAKGCSVTRARAKWVATAAYVLARRFGDDLPKAGYVPAEGGGEGYPSGTQVGYREAKGRFYPVYSDGFTNLWRRALWTAIRVELYGGSYHGWTLLERMVVHAVEAKALGKSKPSAWAWSITKREGFEELLRDYSTGTVCRAWR